MTEHSADSVTNSKPRVGLSACLAGENVRYDGGNKYQPLIEQYLKDHLELTPFCPEVAAGMGVPRPPVELIKIKENILVLGVENRQLDVTSKLEQVSTKFSRQYSQGNAHNQNPLCGYILKSRSPSCGLGSTPVHDGLGNPIGEGNGLFAERLQNHFAAMPIVEENWLNSGWRCRLFVACCYLARSLTNEEQHGLEGHTELDANSAREMFDSLLNLNQHDARDFVASIAVN